MITKKTTITIYKPNYSAYSAVGVTLIWLKIFGVINWNWLWILSPFWIPFATTFFLYISCVMIWFVFNLFDKHINIKWKKKG